MYSIFWKIFLAMWLSIVGFSATIGWLNDTLARRQWAEQPQESFERGLYRISQRAQQALRDEGRRGLRDELLNIPRMTRGHIYIVDEDNAEVLGRDQSLDDLLAQGAVVDTEQVTDSSGKPYTVYTVNRTPPRPILAPGPEGTALRLAAAALISAIISFFLARSLSTPVGHLRRASRQIAGGELSARVGAKVGRRKDEIGQLAADFDDMAERLQAMQTANRRLLQDVSHELRSPLARMSVALEIARNKGPGPVAGEIDRIALEGARLETLVNDVLALLKESSETARMQDQEFDLSVLIDDLVEVVNYEVPEGKPGIDWTSPGAVPMRGDRELVWRAVENLLRNALRHTDPDRGVVLSLSTGGRRNRTTLSVRDYGLGVPEAELEKIFEPFYRVQESRDRGSGGHGLGLSIASTAVRRHDGEIRASNAPDGGLIVEIRLPV